MFYCSTESLDVFTDCVYISSHTLLRVRALTFACVLGDIDAKLNDVTGQDLAGRTLLRAAAQPLAVDERPVAAFSVLQVELTHRHNR